MLQDLERLVRELGAQSLAEDEGLAGSDTQGGTEYPWQRVRESSERDVEVSGLSRGWSHLRELAGRIGVDGG